jgi:hypothetical protein
MAESIEQFSYELTANALAEQERAVGALRARAGTVLGAASIAGSFLGTKASHGSLDGWAIAALITFALCLASAVWVPFPRRFVFAVRGEMLLTQTDLLGIEDVAEAYRAAISWIEPHLDRNRYKLARISGWFNVACVLLAAEVVLWTLSLTS